MPERRRPERTDGAGDDGRTRPNDAEGPEGPDGPWFAARLPAGWCAEPPRVLGDRDELLVLVSLPPPPPGPGVDAVPVDAVPVDAVLTACRARVHAFREATRPERMAVADEAERLFGRKVSWGAQCGDHREVFTTLSVPVMTRLRIDERLVLDTLIAAGVARSRSDALAWCVRLVARHEHDWIAELAAALDALAAARARGPNGSPGSSPLPPP